jgi:hypothetical protein
VGRRVSVAQPSAFSTESLDCGSSSARTWLAAEQRVREFLSAWEATSPAEPSGIRLPDFEKQSDSLIAIRPTVVSSIMGLYSSPFVAKLKDQGIAWFFLRNDSG